MSTLYRYLCFLALLALVLPACNPPAVSSQSFEQESFPYQEILGKSWNDLKVMNWMTTNDCTNAAQFQICNDAGVVFWMDADQTVKQVYLYLNNEEGLGPYKGNLPLGIKFYDTMAGVEYKLNRQGVGNAGLPERAGTPDRFHYWATYVQAGMTIIYNAPFPDEDATIYAILLSS